MPEGPANIHDAVVVGGGVVGCAVFRALVLAGLDAVLIERGADLLSGASKGNSATLVIPRDLKLESGEELGVQFHFRGTPGKSVTLQRNQ